MKKVKSGILVFLITISFSLNAYANGDLSSNLKGVLLREISTGETMYSYNTNEEMDIASITKLMTYLICKEAVDRGDIGLYDEVKIGPNPQKNGGSSFYIRENERYRLDTLIKALLIPSANDAAVAIAEYVAGSETEFVNKMNKRAKELGLENTEYVNCSGLPMEDKSTNKMDIEDIYKLSKYIIENHPEILEITSMKEFNIQTISNELIAKNITPLDEKNRKKYKTKENTNPLVGKMENADGLKTGFTNGAGFCLISTMKVPVSNQNDKEYRVIGISMGAKTMEERAEKSKDLMEHAKSNFSYKKLISNGELLKSITIDNAKNVDVEIFASKDVYDFIERGENITKEIILYDTAKAPLKEGESVGKLIISNEEKVISEQDIVVNREVKKINVFTSIYRYFFGV